MKKINKDTIFRLSSLIGLILLILALSILSPKFRTVDNLFNILRQVTVNALIAFGMTFVILTGGIDLSVGSVVAVSGALVAGMMIRNNLGTMPAILIALISGVVMGGLNGVLISNGKVPAFVGTLATQLMFRGFTLVYTGGRPISNLNESFAFIGKGYVFKVIPVPVVIMLVTFILLYIVLRKTKFGKHVYAIGGSEQTAYYSGINVKRTKLFVYIIGGVLAAMSGIILTSRLNSAQATAGQAFESDAIASVVVGGTSLSGGKGWIVGTLIGASIIGVLTNGLNLLGVHAYYQQIIKGAVIIGSVLMDRSE